MQRKIQMPLPDNLSLLFFQSFWLEGHLEILLNLQFCIVFLQYLEKFNGKIVTFSKLVLKRS